MHVAPDGSKINDKGYRRLRSHIRFMEKQRPARRSAFNMGSWFNHDGAHQLLKPREEVKIRHLQDCGTSACAFGWACVRPTFRKEGLAMVPKTFDISFKVGSRTFESGIEAAKRFFRIDEYTALKLFSGGNKDRTPKQWARRARVVLGITK